MSVQSACDGCIQFPVTLKEFLLGIDTAKTDLSSHSALKAFILFDNTYWAWLILSQGESMQTLHRSGQKIWLRLFAIANTNSQKGKHYTDFVEAWRKHVWCPVWNFGSKWQRKMQNQLQFERQSIFMDVAYLDFSSCFIIYSHHLSLSPMN